jgi:hypothetical protein
LDANTIETGDRLCTEAVALGTAALHASRDDNTWFGNILLAYEHEITQLGLYACLFVLWATKLKTPTDALPPLKNYRLVLITVFIDTMRSLINARQASVRQNAQKLTTRYPTLGEAILLCSSTT